MQREPDPEDGLLARFSSRTDPRLAPKTMIVVAHADDEVIGAGGRFPWLPRVTFVHVTDSSPRNPADARAAGFPTRKSYARARRKELGAVLALAGVPPERSLEIGVRDQEASFHLPEIAQTLAGMIGEKKPEVVLTHSYQGGHPDHDATAFAAAAAVELSYRSFSWRPGVIEFAGYSGADGVFRTFEFVSRKDCPEVVVTLTASERRLKKRMIACFPTQMHLLRRFPVKIERFRRAPVYAFTEPPHPGRLFYENFDWGMTGEKWRELAGNALLALDLGGL